jgi:hypothetical protein
VTRLWLLGLLLFAVNAHAESAAAQLAALLEPVQRLSAQFTQTVHGTHQELLQSTEGYLRLERPQQFKWVLLAPYFPPQQSPAEFSEARCRALVNAAVGQVTSGGPAPTLEKNIGMGYVPPRLATPGSRLSIDCRGKRVDAEVVAGPFYKRSKKEKP